ncbi:hypothetical protein FQZ97_1142130 [compost metagenome]
MASSGSMAAARAISRAASSLARSPASISRPLAYSASVIADPGFRASAAWYIESPVSLRAP